MPAAERLEQVRLRIASACARAGRDPAGITLVAVSKGFPASAVAEAAALGLVHFGENRVQEARQKIPVSPAGLVWHMVGHLQRNKAREAARLFDWLHSLDSASTARELDGRLGALGRRMQVLVEVKLSPEPTKSGVPPEQLPELVGEVSGLGNLSLRGLMTMPPPWGGAEGARPYFRRLRELAEKLAASGAPPSFDQLSMGMSDDLEAAVEEGATMVRVGTAIFGPRSAA